MPPAEHRALALKYRPQVFADLVGQEHVTEVITRALLAGRVAHAYLLTGPRGVGKTTTARILAKALNCERRDARRPATASERADGAPDPCNQCSSCRDITSGVSMDVTEIDGASNRGIADVQMLRERVRFTPAGGRFRVVIIDEVHQLSGDAFAALLKTLEEPPAHLVFIFATTDPLKLPDTIRSRCQRYDFARVPLRKVAERLRFIAEKEAADPAGVHFTLDEGAAILLARQSEGSLRDAVSALDQVVSTGEPKVTEDVVRSVLGLPDHQVFFQLAETVLARDPAASLQAIHKAYAAGLEPRDLVEGINEHLRNVLVLKTDPSATELVAASQDDIDRYKKQGADWSAPDLLRLMRIGADASGAMRDSSQPLLHLEAAVVQMASLEPGKTLAEILQRLRDLESRLGGEPHAAAPASAATRASGSAATGDVRRPPSAPPARGNAMASVVTPVAAAPLPVAAAPAPVTAAPLAAAVAIAPSEPDPIATALMAPAADVAGDLMERWSLVLRGVNERKRMLGAFLSESRLVAIGDRGLTLAMDDLHRTVLDDRENRALLSDEIERVFGSRLQFTCEGPQVGAATAAAPRRPLTSADVQPMIERAVEYFDGEAVQRSSRAPSRPDRPREMR